MARLLVHIATGPDDPNRVTLGLLVAKTARQQGHEVDVFVAGDAVHMVRAETRDAVNGLGTGNAAEHWTALVDGGARFFGSRMSANAREITAPEGVELVPPDKLVELIMSADRVITY